MDSTVIAEKMARDPLFDPKMMGLRSAEVKELRSSNPALATAVTARSNEPMKLNHQLHMSSSTNISSPSHNQSRSLREHNKRFSASAIALHSNHMFSSSRGSSTALSSYYPVQDRSRSLKNLSNFSNKSLDKDDRAILTWLTGVVGYKISDYSMLYDGYVLCQLINTIKSNAIDADDYRDKTPAERLQIAFFAIKEHLNINGPPAPIESIIEGKEDDLLFLYLEKIKLFYCTSYGPTINTKMYGSTKSLGRSHSLNAADNKRPMREYRSQTSSPYPPPLYANNSCTNLQSIKETSSDRKVHGRNPRPHSYHELSTAAHLMSASGARVISVETGSASEHEDESIVQDGADEWHAQVANSNNKVLQNNSPASKTNNSQLKNVVTKTSTITKAPTLTGSPHKRPSDQNHVLNSGESQDSLEGKKCSSNITPTVTLTRHQRPPLPKAPPPPPPTVTSVKRQVVTQMESTDGQSSLQTFLSLSQSKRDLENIATAVSCETCLETQIKIENVIKKERELILYPLQKAFESEKKRRICLEQKYRKAVRAAKRKIDYYESCIDDLSEKISSLTSQVEAQQKSADQRLAELSKQLLFYRDEFTSMTTSHAMTTPPHDVSNPTPTDDIVQGRKTFRLFRKTTSKKKTLHTQPSKEKSESRLVSQTTSLKAFPTKDYSEHVENLITFLQKLGYSHLAEKFISNDIGLKELILMDESHMESIGVPMGPRLRILQEIQTLKTANT